MKKMKFALTSLIFVIVMACQTNEEKSKKEVETVVAKLYAKDAGINDTTRDNLFSKTLLQKIEAIRELTKKSAEQIAKSDSPTDKGLQLEGALYSSLGDGFSKHTIKSIEIKENTAEVSVDFEYNSTPIIKWTDKVIMINENGWKVDNVKFDTKYNSSDDLIEKLDPLSFSGEVSKDVITNSKGESLKVTHDIKNDVYTINFNNQKATLKKEKSANGVYYSDGIYDLWFLGNNVSLRKGNTEIFNNGVTEKVDFTEAKNYFVKNDYADKDLHFVKINNDAELNKIFGAATTMGKEGTPTKIDFTKNYAIAVIGKTNNEGNELFVTAYYTNDKGINLTTNTTALEKGKKQTYTSRPSKILIIDKKYKGNISMD